MVVPYSLTEGIAEVCVKVLGSTWVSVVKEPPEGELIEPVVVSVDILVALRPARISFQFNIFEKGEEFLLNMKNLFGKIMVP